MRIIAGSRKSIRLAVPKGMKTRPTMDRTKETLFNILCPDILGSRFLDLFSGSGSIGLEALSRGAGYAVFVEKDRAASDCIKENIQITRFGQQARLLHMDYSQAVRLLKAEKEVFDIIFLDPPFEKGLEKSAFIDLAGSGILHGHSLIVFEASVNIQFNYLNDFGYKIIKEKSYKTHKHVFASAVSEDMK